MKTRTAITAVLLITGLAACTIDRYPGDCTAAPSTTIRTKNRALIHNSVITTVPPLSLSC